MKKTQKTNLPKLIYDAWDFLWARCLKLLGNNVTAKTAFTAKTA